MGSTRKQKNLLPEDKLYLYVKMVETVLIYHNAHLPCILLQFSLNITIFSCNTRPLNELHTDRIGITSSLWSVSFQLSKEKAKNNTKPPWIKCVGLSGPSLMTLFTCLSSDTLIESKSGYHTTNM